MTYPNLLNSYEVKDYQKERSNKVRRDVQRLRIPAVDPGKERGSWVSALMAIATCCQPG